MIEQSFPTSYQDRTSLVPYIFGTGSSFMEDNSSMDQGGGDGMGMIQVHYIYCTLYSISITSAPPQIIRPQILYTGDP